VRTAGGIPAAELHGDLAQGARERNLASFAAGVVRVIVATYVAARGIHVDGIDLAIMPIRRPSTRRTCTGQGGRPGPARPGP
jgi:superfamily II DNA/RNA helicase